MSVWKSDKKLLIFASLISPSKIILFDSALLFNSLLSVSSGGETLYLMLDILHQECC